MPASKLLMVIFILLYSYSYIATAQISMTNNVKLGMGRYTELFFFFLTKGVYTVELKKKSSELCVDVSAIQIELPKVREREL